MPFKHFCTFYACVLFLSLNACTTHQDIDHGDLKLNAGSLVSNPLSASGKAANGVGPVFTFVEEQHDFGNITAGEKVAYSFKFKNTGNANLIIASAAGSCGCTVPEWPKEPIAPGQENVINVIFNSEGKSGAQHKTVTLTANTIPNTKILTITGDVSAKK
jgi:hypothetical protein